MASDNPEAPMTPQQFAAKLEDLAATFCRPSFSAITPASPDDWPMSWPRDRLTYGEREGLQRAHAMLARLNASDKTGK